MVAPCGGKNHLNRGIFMLYTFMGEGVLFKKNQWFPAYGYLHPKIELEPFY